MKYFSQNPRDYFLLAMMLYYIHTSHTALYPDPDTAGISRMVTCTAGEVGTSTDLYEK
eukprot:SAG31_NODE_4345_length_3329_cov_3.417957_3_plen_57_part_01